MSHSTLGKRKPVQQNVQGGAGQGSANHGSASSSSISEVTIKVNRLQRGNPLLQHLTNMPWAFTKPLDADYVVGRAACVLFLSVKYHMLHPKYLLARMGKLRFKYTVRILLCQVDRQNDEPLQEISRLAFVNGWSLLCAWSPRECARYIETLKSYESKSADSLKKKVDKHNSAKTLESAITTIRSVNSKDVKTLAVNFGSFKNIAEASMDKLAICPGLGPKKTHTTITLISHVYI
eukprot:jgi/Bigna1/77820/fgenesh1_pg.50_\